MDDGRGGLTLMTDPEWRIGDDLLVAIAAGARPGEARDLAALASRRELCDVTWIARTCEAFPPSRRRSGLPFAHHLAALKLTDAGRDAMLDQAVAEGWSARQMRREVTARRIATGEFFPVPDDDPEDREYRMIAQAWNRAGLGARELFVESVEEATLDDIEL